MEPPSCCELDQKRGGIARIKWRVNPYFVRCPVRVTTGKRLQPPRRVKSGGWGITIVMHTGYANIANMQLTFVHLKGFTAEWKHFRLTDDDLRAHRTSVDAKPRCGRGDVGNRRIAQIAFLAAFPARRQERRLPCLLRILSRRRYGAARLDLRQIRSDEFDGQAESTVQDRYRSAAAAQPGPTKTTTIQEPNDERKAKNKKSEPRNAGALG